MPPKGRTVGHYTYKKLNIDAHPERDVDVKTCAECCVEKDAILFDLYELRGHGLRLSDTCMVCERAAGVGA